MSLAYDAVVFDLDGTLVDSAPALQKISARFFDELGAEALSLEETRAFIGHGSERFVRCALEARGLADPDRFEQRFAQFTALYAAAPGTDNPFYPGVAEALDALAKAGIALGLCTNKPGRPTDNVLKAHALEEHFGVVVTADTLASRKPDPEPLLHAVRALGSTPRRALYVGDSEVDAQTAASAGVDFALFANGYREAPIADLTHRFVLQGMDDLVPLVLR